MKAVARLDGQNCTTRIDSIVMPAHSRSQNGVASLASGGQPRLSKTKTWMAETSPAMTDTACSIQA
jgi:hypothetical protein